MGKDDKNAGKQLKYDIKEGNGKRRKKKKEECDGAEVGEVRSGEERIKKMPKKEIYKKRRRRRRG